MTTIRETLINWRSSAKENTMKMITSAIVCLFACAAMAEGTTAPAAQTAAPTAPAAAMQAKDAKTAPKAAMQAKKDETCAGKTGKDLKKCKADMKKATH
jgi:hypothetical protein